MTATIEGLTPLWLDRPRADRPRLTEDATYDVVVAGGGIVGVLTALLLARAGRRVAVLEARHVGAGTTGHTTAKVSVLQGTRLSRAARSNPPSVLRDYVTANREGLAWLRDFCSTHDVAHQDRPAFTYATTRVGEVRLQAEHSVGALAGLDATWEDESELPYPVRGTLRLDDQMQLHPLELLDALVEQLVDHGGDVFEHTRVTDVQPSPAGRVVTTEGARVRAAHVVLATGQPVLRRHGFFARLHPQRSYAAALTSPWVPHGMHLSSDPASRSIRSYPAADGSELLLVGGAGHITGRAASEAEHLEELVGWATSTFGGSAVTHTWSAQDHATVTGLPYVGPMRPRRRDMWVATGFDKWGLAAAPAAALLLTKSILAEGGAGERPPWHRAFSSWTPRESAGAARAVRFSGGVGLELTKDVLGRRWREAQQADPPVQGICTHLGGSVRWNDAERSWDCPLHGSRFGTDGEVLEGPAVCGLRRLDDRA